MCPEGKMSAYSNKDLDSLISQYMAEPPIETYTNAEYSRLTKGETNFQASVPATQVPAAHCMPAIEVDVAAGTHTHFQFEQQEEQLKQRLASMEAELEKLRNVVTSGTSAAEVADAVQRAMAVNEEVSVEEESRVGRKRSPPPLDCEQISSCPTPVLAAGFMAEEERDCKRQCRPELSEDCPPAFMMQAGVGREVSWDLASFYSAPTPLDTLNSPFNFMNTPVAAGGPFPLLSRC
eukprot:2890118-Rhodomonas_salina.1